MGASTDAPIQANAWPAWPSEKNEAGLRPQTDDYGIFNLTGKRSWLKLTEPESAVADPVATELVFIGKPDGITDDTIGAPFEQVLAEANAPDNEGYVVKDLLAFHVVFA